MLHCWRWASIVLRPKQQSCLYQPKENSCEVDTLTQQTRDQSVFNAHKVFWKIPSLKELFRHEYYKNRYWLISHQVAMKLAEFFEWAPIVLNENISNSKRAVTLTFAHKMGCWSRVYCVQVSKSHFFLFFHWLIYGLIFLNNKVLSLKSARCYSVARFPISNKYS